MSSTPLESMIICPACGKDIPADSDFCQQCGANIHAARAQTADASHDAATHCTIAPSGEGGEQNPAGQSETAQPAPSSASLAQPSAAAHASQASSASATHTSHNAGQGATRGVNIIGILLGIVFVVAGLIVIIMANPGCELTSFGGDAYTYIYHGIVAIANTLTLATRALGGCLMALGIFMSLHFYSREFSK